MSQPPMNQIIEEMLASLTSLPEEVRGFVEFLRQKHDQPKRGSASQHYDMHVLGRGCSHLYLLRMNRPPSQPRVAGDSFDVGGDGGN